MQKTYRAIHSQVACNADSVTASLNVEAQGLGDELGPVHHPAGLSIPAVAHLSHTAV